MPLHTTKFIMAWLEKIDSDNNRIKQWLKPSYIKVIE